MIKRVKFDGETRCAYKDRRGNNCAVGRCLIPNSILFKGENNFDTIDTFRDIYTQFKEEYRGHSLDFWVQLQGLHDTKSNWDINGLTDKGQKHTKNLLKTWGNK